MKKYCLRNSQLDIATGKQVTGLSNAQPLLCSSVEVESAINT